MVLIKDKPLISHREYEGMFVMTETPMISCNKCNTSFPILNGNIMCNGKVIKDCPYCQKVNLR